jgi:hypothetical protein
MKAKMFTSVVLFAVTASSNLFGAYAGPVLEQYRDSGFTPPEYFFQETCSIYPDRVEKQGRYGVDPTIVTSSTPYEMPAEVFGLIDAASEGPFVEFPTPADIPSTIIRANVVQPNDAVTSIDLFVRNGGNAYGLQNQSEAATLLIEIVKAACN